MTRPPIRFRVYSGARPFLLITLFLFLDLVLAACAPVPNDPYGAVASTEHAKVEQATATQRAVSGAEATQAAGAGATQAAREQEKHALGILQTQVSISETQQALVEKIEAHQVAVTETQIALSVLDMQAQADIAEAQGDQERAIEAADNFRLLCGGLVVIALLVALALGYLVVRFSIPALAAAFGFIRSFFQIHENRLWDAQERERLERSETSVGGTRYMQTSAGLMVFEHKPVTVVERHLQREADWRAVCKRYIAGVVALGQSGVKYPFSEPAALKAWLVVSADTGKPWSEGYRAVTGLLRAMGIMAETTKGCRPDWADGWHPERFAREFDMSPLPYLPDLPLPGVNFALRGSDVGQVPRSPKVPRLAGLP